MNWIDNALNGHATALQMRSSRAELLAGNIANADTPGFKARDIDFKAEFAARVSGQNRTNENHQYSAYGS
ncbi:MAG: flagellar basal body rod protein FlgB [Candidatus Azotimanducaceae bacterium]